MCFLSYRDQLRTSCQVHRVLYSTWVIRLRGCWCCPSLKLFRFSSLLFSVFSRVIPPSFCHPHLSTPFRCTEFSVISKVLLKKPFVEPSGQSCLLVMCLLPTGINYEDAALFFWGCHSLNRRSLPSIVFSQYFRRPFLTLLFTFTFLQLLQSHVYSIALQVLLKKPFVETSGKSRVLVMCSLAFGINYVVSAWIHLVH